MQLAILSLFLMASTSSAYLDGNPGIKLLLADSDLPNASKALSVKLEALSNK